MPVTNEGITFLRQSLDGVKGFLQGTGGAYLYILFGIGTAVILYVIFRSMTERLGG